MTKVRVQRFLFFAQAESLVRLGRPLFEEDFVAGDHGPMIAAIAECSEDVPAGRPIRDVSAGFDIHAFTYEELEVLLDVSAECGRYSTSELGRMMASCGFSKPLCDTGDAAIPKDSIRDLYSGHRFISPLFREAVSKIPVEGHIDADGRTVLPGDWTYRRSDRTVQQNMGNAFAAGVKRLSSHSFSRPWPT